MHTILLLALAIYYYSLLLIGRRPARPIEIESYIQKYSPLDISSANQFSKIFRTLRSVAQKCRPQTVCFDTSLVMGRLTKSDFTLHFSIVNNANYQGHAWIEAYNQTFTTDQQFKAEPILTIKKNINVRKPTDVHPEV